MKAANPTKIFVSFLLGAAAAGLAIPTSLRPSPPALPLPVADLTSALSTDERVPRPVAPPAPTTAHVSSASHPAPSFHWRQLESTDYRRYIANLRAVGCPESTIRDILIADVRALCRSRSGNTVQEDLAPEERRILVALNILPSEPATPPPTSAPWRAQISSDDSPATSRLSARDLSGSRPEARAALARRLQLSLSPPESGGPASTVEPDHEEIDADREDLEFLTETRAARESLRGIDVDENQLVELVDLRAVMAESYSSANESTTWPDPTIFEEEFARILGAERYAAYLHGESESGRSTDWSHSSGAVAE